MRYMMEGCVDGEKEWKEKGRKPNGRDETDKYIKGITKAKKEKLGEGV